MAKVGIIGGSGLYQIEGIKVTDQVSLFTPYGQPSCNYVLGKLEDTEVVFLPRHGRGHRISPTEINYRANIFGMKKLGVEAIVSVSACGSLKQDIAPLDFVVPDQLIDLTKKRATTFFEGGIVAHVAFAEPFSQELRVIISNAVRDLGLNVHYGGTYLNMEGPQFSTKAESNLYRQWDVDIIGMTTGTEAKLAREAEISYATLAAVTDYDCWYEGHESVTVEMIINNLNQNVDNAKKILKKAIPQIGKLTQFSASDALKTAIVTARDMIPEEKKHELAALIGKYIK